MYSFLFKILKYFLIPFILGIILILILWIINSVYPFFESFITENSSNTLIVLDVILKFLKLNTQISAEFLIAKYSLNNALLNDILFSSILLGSTFSLWRVIITTKRFLRYKNKVAEYYIPLEKSNKFYRKIVNDRFLNSHRLERALLFTSRYTWDVIFISLIFYMIIILTHLFEDKIKVMEFNYLFIILLLTVVYIMIIRFFGELFNISNPFIKYIAKPFILKNLNALDLLDTNYSLNARYYLNCRKKYFNELDNS